MFPAPQTPLIGIKNSIAGDFAPAEELVGSDWRRPKSTFVSGGFGQILRVRDPWGRHQPQCRSALEPAVGARWGPSTLWGRFPKTGVPVAGGRELVPRVRLCPLRWATSPWRSSGRQVRGHFFPFTPGSRGDSDGGGKELA